MIELPSGAFRMGSEVSVAPFAIDRHPVTVAEFRRFVKATGHVTVGRTRAGRCVFEGVSGVSSTLA